MKKKKYSDNVEISALCIHVVSYVDVIDIPFKYDSVEHVQTEMSIENPSSVSEL